MRTLLVVGLAVGAFPLAAQRRSVTLDAVVGGSTTRFSTVEPGRESPVGWTLGVEASTPLGRRLDLAAGLNLLERGDRARFTGTDIEGRPVAYRSATSLRYLTMPVLLRASLGGAFRPQAAFGLEPAVQVGCRLQETLLPAEGQGGSIPCWDGLQDVAQIPVHRLDLGLIASIGASLGRLGLEVRYAHGLRDVYRLLPAGSGGSVQNRSVGIIARVRIHGG